MAQLSVTYISYSEDAVEICKRIGKHKQLWPGKGQDSCFWSLCFLKVEKITTVLVAEQE